MPARRSIARRIATAFRAGAVAWRMQRGYAASFDATRVDRLYSGWSAYMAHPDREVQYSLPHLRARVREQVRNNPLVAGYVESDADMVLGPQGMDLQAKVTNRNGDPATSTNAEIERGWKDFCRAENCSANGKMSFRSIERMAIRMEDMDGEAFIRILEGPQWPHGIALQWIDADQLDDTYDVPPDADGNEVRQGVKVDQYGRELGFWFFARYPYDKFGGTRQRVFVSAADVIHLGDPYRPNQTRYFPRLAAALPALYMLGKGLDADLETYRLQASQGGFLTVKDETLVSAYLAERASRQGPKASEEPIEIRVDGGGVYTEIPPGFGVDSTAFTHPNANIVEFCKIHLRAAARAVGAAYASFTGDASDSNYSSSRLARLPEQDRARVRQISTIDTLHDRVFLRWIPNSLLAGKLKLDSRLASNYTEHAWKVRGWPSVDPLKDGQWFEIAEKHGWLTNSQICAMLGHDFEANVDEKAREYAYAAEKGVEIGGDPALTERAFQTTTAETAAEGHRLRLAA